jgi:hypothetical protein
MKIGFLPVAAVNGRVGVENVIAMKWPGRNKLIFGIEYVLK